MGGPQGPSSHFSFPWSELGASNSFHFLAMLDIPDLNKLTNDPIFHNLLWPPIPQKICTYILKYKGKQGEHQGINITTYHLWCVSNSMVDDSI